MTRWSDRFDALHADAAAAAGHDDFGDTAYHEGMRVLLAALDANPPAGPAAEASATGTITGALAGRLVTQAGWNAHPAYATERIERPLIVIGLPRTGTTALHQLLSMDPQFQGFERWLTANPMVRPPRETWDAHPVYRASVERIAAMQPARARDHGRPFDRGGRGRRMPDADGAELRVQLVRLEHRRARL
nr:sulfotransferase [Sphingopyxis sp. PET50]